MNLKKSKLDVGAKGDGKSSKLNLTEIFSKYLTPPNENDTNWEIE